MPHLSSRTFKTILLSSVASLILTGCWDGGIEKSKTSIFDFFENIFNTKTEEERITTLTDMIFEDYPRQTLSGSYLSSRYAQNEFNWQKANEELSQVIFNDSQNLDLKQRGLILAMGAGETEQALALAKTIKENDPQNAIAVLIATFPDFKDGKYKQVAESLKNLTSNGLNDIISPLVRSWAIAGAIQTGQLPKTTSFLQGLQQNPVHIVHGILIADSLNDKNSLKKFPANILLQLGLSNETLEQIQKIFNKHDLKDDARIIKAYLSSVEGLKAQLEETETINLQNNDIKSAQQGLSQAMYDMASTMAVQAPESAMLFAQLSLYFEPNRVDTPILISQMQGQSGRHNDAIQTLTALLPKITDQNLDVKIKRQIAELLEERENQKQAIHLLRDVVDKSKNLEAQIQIGDIYRRQEKFSEALEEYNRAYELINQNPGEKYWYLIYARGMVHERLKNWDRAEKDLKEALQYRPNNPFILNYLAYSWADQNINLDKAISMLEKAATLKPDDGAIIDSLGWVYFRNGEYQKAVDTLELAIELTPYDSVINDHLGDAYWKVGRKNEARFQWKRALSFSPEPDLKATIEEKINVGYLDSIEDKKAKSDTSLTNSNKKQNPETQ